MGHLYLVYRREVGTVVDSISLELSSQVRDSLEKSVVQRDRLRIAGKSLAGAFAKGEEVQPYLAMMADGRWGRRPYVFAL